MTHSLRHSSLAGLAGFALLAATLGPAQAQTPAQAPRPMAPPPAPTITAPPAPNQAAIASANPLATAAGFEVMGEGGNAFDAAIAVASTLAVVEPVGSGLGGGAFFLLGPAGKPAVFLDARETAPRAVGPDFYLKPDGTPDNDKLRNGPTGAGIPGLPLGLIELAHRYGRLPLAASLGPAIRAARDGFAIDPKFAREIGENLSRFNPSARALLVPNDVPLAAGQTLVQPALARTLMAIGTGERDAFYTGPFAESLAARVRAGGGVWDAGDLAAYDLRWRQPMKVYFRGYTLTTTPPPSAGGIALAEIFGQIEALGLPKGAVETEAGRHAIVETMRRAYHVRAGFLGDPDFVAIPQTFLTSTSLARRMAASIGPRATPSNSLPPETQGTDTTHFSVIDPAGNLVAATMSINLQFGSAWHDAASGIFLNDEMDDFAGSADPASANAYGLAGSKANLPAPGKRPLSSMTPTFISGPNGVALLGSPGGSRIITMVALGALRFTDGDSAGTIVSAPRFHNQYLPDLIEAEPTTFSDADLAKLRARGHTVKVNASTWGNFQTVIRRPDGRLEAASDPRGVGAARVGVVPIYTGPPIPTQEPPMTPPPTSAYSTLSSQVPGQQR